MKHVNPHFSKPPAGYRNKPVGRLIRLRKSMLERIDEEWHRRGLMSRTATIRILLAEAMEKS